MGDRVHVTGQLFYAGDRAGPMFAVTSIDPDGPYNVVLTSVTGNHVVDEKGFKTVGEAVEWAYGHSEW
jgi:hypothetical protein